MAEKAANAAGKKFRKKKKVLQLRFTKQITKLYISSSLFIY